jgi:hypothetical protein
MSKHDEMQVCLRTREFVRTMDGHPSAQTAGCEVERLQQRVAAHEHSEDNDCICTSKRLIHRFALMQLGNASTLLLLMLRRCCCMLLAADTPVQNY